MSFSFALKIVLSGAGNQFDFMLFGIPHYGSIPRFISKRFHMIHITAGLWKSYTFYGGEKPKRFVVIL